MTGRARPGADAASPPDPGAIDGAPAPRESRRLIGHNEPWAAFETAFAAGRAHHAWLLTGPPGVGKATFAHHAARRALLGPPPYAPAQEAQAAQLRAGAHPRAAVLSRSWNDKTKKFRSAIGVDDVRRLSGLFRLSAAEGGWRAAIVDTADALNTEASNALLKLLEEPPPQALFLLISNAPGRLPATIRSRCRRLALRALAPTEADAVMMETAPDAPEHERARLLALFPGAPGAALRFHAGGGLEDYALVLSLLKTLAPPRPSVDARRLARLLETVAGRGGAERLEAVSRLLVLALSRAALRGAGDPCTPSVADGELAILERLAAPDAPNAALRAAAWSAAALEIETRLDTALRLNLDPQRTILDMAEYLAEAAQSAAR